eukprot:scaffold76263_cov38-Prasinocladus_malaysianus.AAC.2
MGGGAELVCASQAINARAAESVAAGEADRLCSRLLSDTPTKSLHQPQAVQKLLAVMTGRRWMDALMNGNVIMSM